MKYIEFCNKFKNYPLIRISDIKNAESDFDHRRLYEWQKKGYLEKVANSFYIFTDKNFTDHEVNFIANKLYEPSYLSLEYALNYYSLIPEVVFWRTSVTSKKTKNVISKLGNFSYRKIKKELFFGYKLVEENRISFKIAEPEKAMLDFLYLRSDLNDKDAIEELRINKERYNEIINKEKLNKYLEVFDSKILVEKIKILNNLMLK